MSNFHHVNGIGISNFMADTVNRRKKILNE